MAYSDKKKEGKVTALFTQMQQKAAKAKFGCCFQSQLVFLYSSETSHL